MTQNLTVNATVPVSASGQRLDQVSANLFPDYSRERLKSWIKSGSLTVDGCNLKPNTKVLGGERLELRVDLEPQGEWQAQAVEFEVVHVDPCLIVVNKPAGLVVHPAAGNYDGTLLNGLLARFPELVDIPRAGIVHRLDKDTTGLMVVARNLKAQTSLVAQLQARSVSREYIAVCKGIPPSNGVVDAPIGRDPKNRKKMAVVKSGGKEAVTHFRLTQALQESALITLNLETGRTHQIRVHMADLGFPLLGDPLYGRKLNKKSAIGAEAQALLESFGRQALHAQQLGLIHPETQELCQWQAAVPRDMQELIDALKR